MKNAKLISTAKVIDNFSKIIQVIVIATMGLCLASIPLILIFGDKVQDSNQANVTLGMLSFVIKESDAPSFSAICPRLVCLLIGCIIVSLILLFGLFLFRKLLKPMREGLPFSSEAPATIAKLGWLVIFGSIAYQVIEIESTVMLLGAVDFERLLVGSSIEKVFCSYYINPVYIFIGLILIFLSYVFQYGQKLQQESDETL